jgi:hypothetical protein
MYLQSVFFTCANRGIAVGKQGIILRTTNGGNNWFTQSCPTNLELRYVQFINENTGTIAGGNSNIPVILRTTDAGNTWVMQNGNYPIGLKGVFFVDANTGYCSAWLGEIFKTIDGGATWQSQHTSQSLEGLWFTNANTGTIVGYNGTIIRTTDGGSSWIHQNPGPTTWYFGCYFENLNTGYVTGYTGTLLKTTNGGTNWFSILSGVSNNLYMISVTNGNCESSLGSRRKSGTIVGSGGIILHNNFDDCTTDQTGINLAPKEVPNKYSLMQNYPNPFNPTTNIKYQIAGNSFVSLIVIDALGREVATLVNENQSAGTYEATFNASQYSSGVYYYKLTAGGFTETKKMLIVK